VFVRSAHIALPELLQALHDVNPESQVHNESTVSIENIAAPNTLCNLQLLRHQLVDISLHTVLHMYRY
jgi:uncharacterized membrane protein